MTTPLLLKASALNLCFALMCPLSAQKVHAGPDEKQLYNIYVNQIMTEMDKNGDKKISVEEFLAASKKEFIKTDKNHDSFITAEELLSKH